MALKLGSLFDGSGGFPLAGRLCGIEPVWAAKIEPYPVAVTKSRFPAMKHLGSVTDINGAQVDPVDVITFGSPCQDLSVAGKRAGLKHEANGDEETTRSGLFMEAVRIIKEMREATHGKYPSFALWENVPGAFSSNKGEDFRIVLEELIKIIEPSCTVPAPDKNGWPYADCYLGTGWSLAYRVFDAQYWGVPQRRRRIHLVLDLRGERAREVLFEREGVRGYFETDRTPWQGIASHAEDCTGADDRAGAERLHDGGSCENCEHRGGTAADAAGWGTVEPQLAVLGGGRGLDAVGADIYNLTITGDRGCSLTAGGYGSTGTSPKVLVPYTLKIRSGCEGGGKGALVQEDKSATLATNNDQYLFQPVTLEPGIAAREGGHIYEGVSGTLRAEAGDNRMAVAHMVLDDQGGSSINVRTDGKSPTLRAETHGNLPCVMELKAYSIENHPADSRVDIDESGKVQTLTSRMGTGGGNVPMVMEPAYCLQGNGIDRADTAGCNGKGWTEDTCYTLNTIDRPAVAYLASGKDVAGCLMASGYEKLGAQEMFSGDYTVSEEKPAAAFAMQGFGDYKESEVASGLKARDYKDATDLVCGVDCRNMTELPELYPTPQGKPNGGRSLNFSGAVRVRYIVRRLTPTECARLQGFYDNWGHPDKKDDFTDDEYQFWLNVRNTHAAINGKIVKDYTKAQMLTWYNKLHTDSSEYKMWGNGIALPCALYVMQGIAQMMADKQPK